MSRMEETAQDIQKKNLKNSLQLFPSLTCFFAPDIKFLKSYLNHWNLVKKLNLHFLTVY